MEVLLEGRAPIRFTHPDDFREWVRTHKPREPVEKLLSAREAVAQRGHAQARDARSATPASGSRERKA